MNDSIKLTLPFPPFKPVIVCCEYKDSPVIVPESHGIYVILNSSNNHFYVGSTVNLRQRWRQHLWSLDNNRHHNPHIQNAWNKYTGSSFVFLVVEIIGSPSNILNREQAWIDELGASERKDCYNFCKIAGSHLGRKRSELTKQRLSEANRGKIHKPEAKEKMRIAKLGRKLTEEHKMKVAERSKGNPGHKLTDNELKIHRKLTIEQAKELRLLRSAGWLIKDLAQHFCIGKTTAHRITRGESYKGV